MYFNTAANQANVYSTSSSAVQYSCYGPLVASGYNNIASDPGLLQDHWHLASNSPCLAKGKASDTVGSDLDTQPWANPPAMGCDEWQPQPVIGLQPRFVPAEINGQLSVAVEVAGQSPFTCWWSKDGSPLDDGPAYSSAHTTGLVLSSFDPSAAGAYQVVVSNAFGVATSQVVRLSIRFVSGSGTSPAYPYTNWLTAATNIQDAIDVSTEGDLVCVTNGIYATGGKIMAGDLTNRVALDKALLVQSINGPAVTTIWGNGAVTGTSAVRCA